MHSKAGVASLHAMGGSSPETQSQQQAFKSQNDASELKHSVTQKNTLSKAILEVIAWRKHEAGMFRLDGPLAASHKSVSDECTWPAHDKRTSPPKHAHSNAPVAGGRWESGVFTNAPTQTTLGHGTTWLHIVVCTRSQSQTDTQGHSITKLASQANKQYTCKQPIVLLINWLLCIMFIGGGAIFRLEEHTRKEA